MTETKTPPKPNLSIAEQITVLQNLSQAAAARMLGISGTTLRAYTDAPRNSDGSYNAAKLVAWRMRNLPWSEISRQFMSGITGADDD